MHTRRARQVTRRVAICRDVASAAATAAGKARSGVACNLRLVVAAQRGECAAAARMGAGILGVDPDRHIVRIESLVVAAQRG